MNSKRHTWNKELLLKELNPICKKLGHLPSQNKLKELNKRYIDYMIIHLGGYSYASKITGYPQALKIYRKNKHQKKLEKNQKLLIKLNTIIKELGHFPKKRELTKNNNWDVYNFIRSKGGILQVSKKLNYKIDKHLYLAKDGHYVRSSYEAIFDNFMFVNNIKHEVDGLADKQKRKFYRYDFKIFNDFKKEFLVEIWGFYRGKKDYLKKRIDKEKFYKKNKIKYLSVEANIFRGKNIEVIYNNLRSWFIKKKIKKNNFKKFNKSLPILTYSVISLDKIKNKLIKISKDLGRLPTYNELKNLNEEKLSNQISFLGGVKKISNILNIKTKKNYNGYNLKELKHELKPFIVDNFMPPKNNLKKRQDIIGFINDNGGFRKFAKKLKLKSKEYEDGYWDKIKNLNPLIESILFKLGKVPTKNELLKFQFGSSAYRAIKKKGGIKKFFKDY